MCQYQKLIKGSSVFILGTVLRVPFALAGTCALCKMNLEQIGGFRLTTGFYWSILLIVSVPLMILIFAGVFYYRATQKRLSSLDHDQSEKL